MSQATVKVPKRISTEDLRKALGDKRTEDLLTVIFGPQMVAEPPLRVEKETMVTVLEVLEDKRTSWQDRARVPSVFRLYFRETPHAKARMATWLRRKIALVEQGEGVPGLVVKVPSPSAHRPRNKRPSASNAPSVIGMP